MSNTTLKEKLRYRFDNLMSKGTVMLVSILFGITALVAVVAGILLSIITRGDTSVGGGIWASIMYIIDAGTITGADTSDAVFIVIMSLVTLCGLFVTSILIGIITTGFEEKLNDLRKGTSRVIECGHTVILGFDSNVYTLISELLEANANKKNACIVILSQEDKEEMESMISAALPDTRGTRIICRTGNVTDGHMLYKCAVERAQAVIINQEEDFVTIKAVLALNNYLEPFQSEGAIPHIVTTIQETANYDALQLISMGNLEPLLVGESVSKIIAQSCRQPGLSSVLIELFDYAGDELYFESCPQLAGQSFGQALNAFPKSVLFGIQRGEKVLLNPDKELILEEGDKCLLLVEDDDMAKVTPYTQQNVSHLMDSQKMTQAEENVLIIGDNAMTLDIIAQLDDFYEQGDRIVVASHQPVEGLEKRQTQLSHVQVENTCCDIGDRQVLESLITPNIKKIILLSSNELDGETADALTLLKLIHLRDIAKKTGRNFSITSQMQNTANQKLAQVTQVNDLVVGSNIINLILNQISENRNLSVVFQELLTAQGSEIHIHPAANYVKLGVEMDFFAVTQIMCQHNQVAVGYKKQADGQFQIVTNPEKSEKIVFSAQDSIITLAED